MAFVTIQAIYIAEQAAGEYILSGMVVPFMYSDMSSG